MIPTAIPVTFFTDRAAQFKREDVLGPAELARRITDMVAPVKDGLPWLKLARFGDSRSDKKSLRHDANVLAITGIEADYDGEEISFSTAVEIAKKAGVGCIIYTSPSHEPAKPRWRVLCPLSHELPPAERHRLVARLNGVYGGIFAAESFTLSQSYYYGRVVGCAEYRVEVVEGTPIDLLDGLDETAMGKPNGSTDQAGDAANGSGTNFNSRFGLFDEDAIAAEIVSGKSYHAAYVRLLGKWAYHGVPFLEALHRLKALFEQVPEDRRDQRWRARYADIPRCLRDIYGKEARKKDAAAEEAAANDAAGAAEAAHDDEDFEEPPKASRPDGKANNADRRGLPVIRLSGGSLPHSVDEAEQILIEHDPEVFQRGDFVVRSAKETITISDQRQARGLRLVPIRVQHLVERLTRIIDFQRFDLRSKKWGSINCPPNVAAAYLERVGSWKLPVLTGIVNAPTLRPDGSILDQAGYDTETGILYAPSEKYPQIPQQPTQQQARAALNELIDLISEFPFVAQDGEDATGTKSPSRSVALSAILTAVIRRSIPHAPLHAFTAPVMGSGKSKLVDIASMVATGHEAPVISQGRTEEEMEKRLGAALIAGDTLISFDNCEQALGGELLCQALTQPVLKIRILGKSVIVAVPSNAMFAATGNNLIIAGDMVRRTIVGTLDPRVERPETRTFKGDDPIVVIRRDRPRYVTAALVVLRAYIVAGSPEQGAKPLGSFEGWSRMVRDALLWLGEDDPCATIERARAEDPHTQALGEVLLQWWQAVGEVAVTVKRAIQITEQKQAAGRPDRNASNDFDDFSDEPVFAEPGFKHPEFRDALLEVAGERGVISNMRLGKWLAKNKGRVVGGLRIDPGTGARGGVLRWKLNRAPEE